MNEKEKNLLSCVLQWLIFIHNFIYFVHLYNSERKILYMEKSPSLILTQTLDLPAAVAGFYVQEAVLSMVNNMEHGSLYFHLEETIHTLRTIHQKYVNQLAGAFFDYISLACFGEARHAIKQAKKYIHQICYKWNHNDDQENIDIRNKSYQHALKFDPHIFLPTLAELFTNGEWKDSYGGQKWANIADAGSLYNSLPNTVFIDHVVDLSHNGGSMFNKDILFLSYSTGSYWEMLHAKRNMQSILVNDFLNKNSMAKSVRPFLKLAAKCGLIDAKLIYGNDYTTIQFPDIIKWGLLPIKIDDILPNEDLHTQLEKSDDCDETQIFHKKYSKKVPKKVPKKMSKKVSNRTICQLAPGQTSWLDVSWPNTSSAISEYLSPCSSEST